MKQGIVLPFPVRTNAPRREIAIQDGNTIRLLHCAPEPDYVGAMMPPDISPPVLSSLRSSMEQYLSSLKQASRFFAGLEFDSLLIPAQGYPAELVCDGFEFVEGPSATLFVGYLPESADEEAELPALILPDSDFL